MEIQQLLGKIPRSHLDSFGKDIDKTNELLFNEPDKEKKKEILFHWVKRFQPCRVTPRSSAWRMTAIEPVSSLWSP
ncbi:hypothetical protein ACL2XP_10875 [Sodalis sp. RH21]|uniref:hypothetical protein n=1 Tax=unclassified Sodalis (in: enterobacteria) TaxID=2636512 RepID=UPI0039B6BEAF